MAAIPKPQGIVAKLSSMVAMPDLSAVVINARRLSVQAGILGGALTAAWGAFQAATAGAPKTHGAVSGAFAMTIGCLTAFGVFAGRMWPQPNLSK